MSHIAYMVVAWCSVLVCWWALGACKLHSWFHAPGSVQARVLHLVLAIVLGVHVTSFVMSFVHMGYVAMPDRFS
ncbi:MAG: DUF1146 family protein [Paenibacillaceae bacterium]|jgi:uncharacterized membrane protein YwzB|nr:DUF1146 family protein [Paenibacillaceae bacterium]